LAGILLEIADDKAYSCRQAPSAGIEHDVSIDQWRRAPQSCPRGYSLSLLLRFAPCRTAIIWHAWRLATCLALLALTPIDLQAQGLEGGTVKSQHGDWQIVCRPPPPGAKNEICAIVQSVTAEDRNNVGLTVYFQRFSDGRRVLRVFAPLGVLLPPGLGLKIDNKDVGHAPFVRCNTFACYAQVVVEDPLVEQLKNGKSAVFIIFQSEEAGIGIPISLAGFGQALNNLR
jgi:invasion protein IalB